jgi:hypothetical protein
LLPTRQGRAPLAKHYPWQLRTKLERAAELARWLGVGGGLQQALGLAVDGAYAKRPFLKPVLALGRVAVSRLRKDAPLMALPPAARQAGQRGPLPTSGKGRIDRAKRAGQRRGWQRVERMRYGERVAKVIKTLEATWRPAGGRIRVVIVRGGDGWLAFFCTRPEVTAAATWEAMADGGAIEQAFQDVKEVWGAGQQPERNLLASIGVFAEPGAVQRGGSVGVGAR